MTTPAEARAIALAAAAGLPLERGRAAIAGALLDAWLASANELLCKMSALEHMALLSATVFTHPSFDDDA